MKNVYIVRVDGNSIVFSTAKKACKYSVEIGQLKQENFEIALKAIRKWLLFRRNSKRGRN